MDESAGNLSKVVHAMNEALTLGRRADEALGLNTRQCTATSRSGERCKNVPIVGGFVCRFHGGSVAAVREAARQRLLALVDPALDALLRALRSEPPCEVCGRSDADRDPTTIRAAQLVLDRCGYGPSATLHVDRVENALTRLSLDELVTQAEETLNSLRALRDAEHEALDVKTIEATEVRDDARRFAEPTAQR